MQEASRKAESPSEILRHHYAATANDYDRNFGETPEHDLAIRILYGLLDLVHAESLLDVGAGTGKALQFFAAKLPAMRSVGLEPNRALREVAAAKGIPASALLDGQGENIPFPDNSFDFVAEFGILHHVEDPDKVVQEMLRVARYGIFLSDTNNLGQGHLLGRVLKGLAFWSGLWKLSRFIRTRGKGFVVEPNDGLWYHYTLFQHYRFLRRHCNSVHLINTRRGGLVPWFSASHVAIFATKKEISQVRPLFVHLR